MVDGNAVLAPSTRRRLDERPGRERLRADREKSGGLRDQRRCGIEHLSCHSQG
jgi:hypothetical protein